MSTVDEVLATAEVVDAVCVIDGETRIISVPNEYKELGVESDEKVTRIKFQCPKIVGDNIDLTEYNLYINYRNAGNKLNSCLVEDATVTGDVINFSWLLSRHVTESPGTISYIVCAKKSDYTGVINEWNTKVATGTVGVGLEATEEIEEQNIDIIEQILRSIVELEKNVGGGSVEDGGYYAPSVDNEGNLTWTASKTDMPAVDGANIKGPAGASGTDGKSAYQYAQDGGFTGTEAEFAAKLAAEKFVNPNALTFTGAVTGSYDGSAPVSVKIPEGGSGEAWELLYETTLTEDAATFSQKIPACSKVKTMIFPGRAVGGWKRIIINGTSYPTINSGMAVGTAYFVSIDTLMPPYITVSIGVYTNPSSIGINSGVSYSSYAMIGDSITQIGCGTAEMLGTGAIIKIWGVRK